MPTSEEVAADPVGCQGFGKCAILVKRPIKEITKDCFEYPDRPLPETLEEGTCLIKHLLISMDPTHRIWMSDMSQYMPSVGLGTVMRAGVTGKVIKSADEAKMPVGTIVSCTGGVAEYSVQPIAMCQPAMPNIPYEMSMSVLSVGSGHTAWIGNRICDAKAGETYVVSGAAGTVGSIAAQLGKIAGARVIGIAGGPDKCKWLTDEVGLDGVIDYKNESIAEGLKRTCPQGVDCYFDNVGGETLDATLGAMNWGGRVAMCGMISEYNLEGGMGAGPSNYKMILMRRLKVEGFICVDHLGAYPEALAELIPAVLAGKIKYKEDFREVGIEDYVDTVNLLYNGGNTGKLAMRLATE